MVAAETPNRPLAVPPNARNADFRFYESGPKREILTMDTDDETLARQALRAILADATAPAAAKASAARTLAEMAGALRGANRAGDGLPNAFEMSREDINAELHGLAGRKP